MPEPTAPGGPPRYNPAFGAQPNQAHAPDGSTNFRACQVALAALAITFSVASALHSPVWIVPAGICWATLALLSAFDGDGAPGPIVRPTVYVGRNRVAPPLRIVVTPAAPRPVPRVVVVNGPWPQATRRPAHPVAVPWTDRRRPRLHRELPAPSAHEAIGGGRAQEPRRLSPVQRRGRPAVGPTAQGPLRRRKPKMKARAIPPAQNHWRPGQGPSPHHEAIGGGRR